MVNNKELIKPLLIFPKPEDSFYFIQIIQRKKDHKGETLGGSNNNSRLIKAYYIYSIDQLEKQWDEMVKLAEVFDARVSINLNPRSAYKATMQTVVKIANQMSNSNFRDTPKAYNSVCGEYHHEIDKRWIVDIDKEDLDKVEDVVTCIKDLQADLSEHEVAKNYKILAVLPSKSGVHIITHPFNVQAWCSTTFSHLELHKNNPTNLYIP